MMVILFRSRLAAAAGHDYTQMLDRMGAHARQFDGFVAVKSFVAEDGERLTVVWWKDADTLEAWAKDAAHRAAKRMGRDTWYQYYEMDVAEIVRVSRFDRGVP